VALTLANSPGLPDGSCAARSWPPPSSIGLRTYRSAATCFFSCDGSFAGTTGLACRPAKHNGFHAENDRRLKQCNLETTELPVRKVIISTASILALALVGSAFWPTIEPDVERFGDSAYETIWLWRVPAYANNPSWRVRWSSSDPLRAQARCCRALSQLVSGPGEGMRILPTAGQPRARSAG
jgi:hypothetical protein